MDEILTNADFELGKIYITRGINAQLEDNEEHIKETIKALIRYTHRDWGDLTEGDKKLNDEALETNEDRILASYHLSYGKIYIITEWNREYTTILLADEY